MNICVLCKSYMFHDTGRQHVAKIVTKLEVILLVSCFIAFEKALDFGLWRLSHASILASSHEGCIQSMYENLTIWEGTKKIGF